MGADADPTNSPVVSDDKSGAAGEIDRVDSNRLMDAVSPSDLSLFIKKNRKGIRVLSDVFPALEEPIDFLRGYEGDAGIAPFKFAVSGLKLSQLLLTVRSPGTTYEHKRQRPIAIVGKPDDRTLVVRQRELWSAIPYF